MRSTAGSAVLSYPATREATAPAIIWENAPAKHDLTPQPERQQPGLFTESELNPANARIIPFDSLTSKAERQMIYARAQEIVRPGPIETQQVQLKRARRKQVSDHQTSLDLKLEDMDGDDAGDASLAPGLSSNITCDVEVAPMALRLQAATLDCFVIAIPVAISVALYRLAGGEWTNDKYALPYFAAALLTVPVLYRLLWTILGLDSPGMRMNGLILVNFDGNPPSEVRRYLRFFGGFLSVFAAGIGLIWSLVDENRLTWHDHISSTFPAISEPAAEDLS